MPLHNRLQTRKLNRQVSFIIAAGLAIITIIAALLVWKEREVESRVYLIDKIGTAAEDFHTGVMHVSLSTKVVFRILCHFVKLSKKEMTYDQNQFRHGCRFKAVA